MAFFREHTGQAYGKIQQVSLVELVLATAGLYKTGSPEHQGKLYFSSVFQPKSVSRTDVGAWLGIDWSTWNDAVDVYSGTMVAADALFRKRNNLTEEEKHVGRLTEVLVTSRQPHLPLAPDATLDAVQTEAATISPACLRNVIETAVPLVSASIPPV